MGVGLIMGPKVDVIPMSEQGSRGAFQAKEGGEGHSRQREGYVQRPRGRGRPKLASLENQNEVSKEGAGGRGQATFPGSLSQTTQ